MSNFKVIETQIKGLLVIEPTVLSDKRDSVAQECSEQELIDMGIDVEFVCESTVKVARGILRGMHFQREQTQGRLVRVPSGGILGVAIDLRPESRTYGAPWSVEVSAENERIYWIPEQFAFGYLTLESNTEIVFKCTDFESPKLTTGVVWNDPILSIDWEFERFDIDEKYLNVSDRDKRLPAFRSWIPSEIWK